MASHPTLRALALLLTLAALGAGGCGDDEVGGPRVRPGRPTLGDAPLVPLSGERPAQVVGASSFSRFHLLTTGEGFPRPAEEEASEGIAPDAAAKVRALEAEASAALGKRKVRSAACLFHQIS